MENVILKGGEQTQSLTQQEYINRINEMSREMNQAWKNDQRVKTLKIVIQVNLLAFSSLHLLKFSFSRRANYYST